MKGISTMKELKLHDRYLAGFKIRLYMFQWEHVILIYSWNVSLVTGPNTGCFHVGDRFWARGNTRPKNWKTSFFQDKFYSSILTSQFIYLATWRAAKLGIFAHFTYTKLPRCSQRINSLIYLYFTDPQLLLWALDHSRDRTSPYYRRAKSLLYCPLSQELMR